MNPSNPQPPTDFKETRPRKGKSDKILEQLILLREALAENDQERSRTPFWALMILIIGLLVYQAGALLNQVQTNQQLTSETQSIVKELRESKQEKFQLSQRLESISLELLRLRTTSPAASRLVEQYGIERR